MVFRGKPSKACERCRARRLRCDHHTGACGQCVRADVACSGYRDTQQLRIQDESKSIVRKAMKNAPLSAPQSLPLSIDWQARDAFFIYFATGTSKCWNFLTQYYHPSDSPDHLTLAIETLSLAYFWHLSHSDVAITTARQRYVSALRMTNNALISPKEATKDTTLLASLLLDLFEKITDSKPRGNKSWTSHIDGALALVKLRGIEHFQERTELHVLIRLINHHIASSLTSATLVSPELLAVRDYVAENLTFEDHTLQVSNVTIEYAKLRNDFRTSALSNNEYVTASKELDLKLEALNLNMPTAWQYSTTLAISQSDRIFDVQFDSYPHRNICYAWNFLRVGRILLNETLIEGYLGSPGGGEYLASLRRAYDNVGTLAGQICASIPQYTDCEGAARKRLPSSENSRLLKHGPRGNHPHTLHHQAECYSLIWPLYAAGRSKAGPDVRPWVIQQLHYIGSHFNIRNAEIVARILEGETDVCPWDVYAILGSYAFNA
ncbi:hypothetical protein N431DRAFT_25801 [Stipitochalara longipes BDJ]|nr:hypothetical protein N431DRAFT_25801 [Stipitochalara longipes BDJ]